MLPRITLWKKCKNKLTLEQNFLELEISIQKLNKCYPETEPSLATLPGDSELEELPQIPNPDCTKNLKNKCFILHWTIKELAVKNDK